MSREVFTAEELARLEAFRDVARQVREASIIDEGRSISLTIFRRSEGLPIEDDISGMLPSEPLRSLAMAVRLAYQNKEPAHFFSVCGLLRKGASVEQIKRIEILHAAWRHTVEGPHMFDYILNGERFTDGDIFHLWLYGVAFHQDLEKKRKFIMLSEAGAFAAFGVQGTALQLAGRILDLDDVIAEILGQEPVPRIKTPA